MSQQARVDLHWRIWDHYDRELDLYDPKLSERRWMDRREQNGFTWSQRQLTAA